MHQWLFHAQKFSVAHGAPHDTAKHISTAFI
jgi:hypothetical protein